MDGLIPSFLRAGLSEHFVEHAVSARPLLLLLDGHSTHYQPQSVHFAKEHGVIMLCLPPHTTHESQPLDCGVFGPLKTQWSHVCHIYFQKHPGKVITRFQFSTLFSEAWGKAASPCNIIAGFCTCGVCNFSDSANVTTASLSHAEGTSHVTVTERDKRFTHEQLEPFQRAYDEGCDVYINPTYVQWLELYHPESLPADRYSLIPAAEESHQMSVAEHFHSVTPEVPLAFANRANAPQSTLDGAVINTISADGTNATQTEATSHDQSNLQCQSILYFLHLPLLPLRPCHMQASLQVQSVCRNWRKKNGKSDWQ